MGQTLSASLLEKGIVASFAWAISDGAPLVIQAAECIKSLRFQAPFKFLSCSHHQGAKSLLYGLLAYGQGLPPWTMQPNQPQIPQAKRIALTILLLGTQDKVTSRRKASEVRSAPFAYTSISTLHDDITVTRNPSAAHASPITYLVHRFC